MDRGLNRITTAALNVLITLEGALLTVYKDIAGKETIGVGHLILHPEDPNLTKVTGMQPSMVRELTGQQVNQLLELDLQKFEDHVATLFDYTLPQNMFDALVLFSFNLGRKAIENGSLHKLIAEKKYTDAVKIMLKYVNYAKKMENGQLKYRTSPGLLKRRFIEAAMLSWPTLPTKKPDGLSDNLYNAAWDLIEQYSVAYPLCVRGK